MPLGVEIWSVVSLDPLEKIGWGRTELSPGLHSALFCTQYSWTVLGL